MKVLNLQCAGMHTFEGWFGSEEDYQSQRERGLVACPLCANTEVRKLPSAPRLNLGAAEPRAAKPISQEEGPVPGSADAPAASVSSQPTAVGCDDTLAAGASALPGTGPSSCEIGLAARGSAAPKFKRGADGSFRTSVLAHSGQATKPLSRCDW